MDIGILPPKPDTLWSLFGVHKPIIGMIHLLALPGAPISRAARWILCSSLPWQTCAPCAMVVWMD